MNKLTCFIFLFYFSYFHGTSQSDLTCRISTDKGPIIIELYPDKAPETVANFLQYVANDAYDGSTFFRVCTPGNESDRTIQIQVIQGGNVSEEQLLPPIPIETTRSTGILHKNGVLSMARLDPNSAQSSFFICIGDQPELDYGGKRHPDGQGFAAFGKVLDGMDVVRQIQGRENKDQYLLEPVLIQHITRLKNS
ncbi:peptidylprolyl isomerase [Cyclobacterium jeungdonense]|uniref:Peptidyl-prolyl cis-trans isomerase n=1 Tax=Cyclobacterium jeungdonense TaxID=708087 RepID=A0ABT8C3H5_9BACT|nr:peptidylprolyl isomerase [Cyclobacterium jeungdonense]MDN3687319.1 peptidylprolyl isomerase [Cyclobacterium jeungdonense]